MNKVILILCMLMAGFTVKAEFAAEWQPESDEHAESVIQRGLPDSDFDIPHIRFMACAPSEVRHPNAPLYIMSDDMETAPQFIYGSKDRFGKIAFYLSDKCASYRVAFISYENEAAATADLMAYMTGSGFESRTRTFPSSQSVIEVEFSKPYRYLMTYVKLDEAGQPIDTAKGIYVYSNYQGEYNWISIGTGSMRENVSHHGVDQSTLVFNENGQLVVQPYVYDVEIEVREDNPSIFRVKNPFGPNHPNFANFTNYIDNLPIAEQLQSIKGDDYYLIINATDPSRVEMEYSLSGFFTDMIFSGTHNLKGWDKMTQKEIDKFYPWEWGKYYDNYISLPQNSVYLAHQTYDYEKPVNDISIKLPGFVNYSFSINRYDETDEAINKGVIITDISPNIASFDCAVMRESERNANRFFYERNYERIINHDPSLEIRNYTVIPGQDLIVKFGDFELSSGRYCMVMVPKDANGEYHHGNSLGAYVKYVKEKNWNYVGKGSFQESIVTNHANFLNGTSTPYYQAEVDIYECPDLPGYFKIIDPYRNFASDGIFYDGSTEHPIYVDATNPDMVALNKSVLCAINSRSGATIPTGLHFNDINDVEQSFFSWYNYNMYSMWENRQNLLEEYAKESGKYKEGVISFPDNSFYFYDYKNPGTITLYLPASGIDGIMTDVNTGSGVTYYNLQGIRVENPSNGVYVQKRGTSSRLIIVR